MIKIDSQLLTESALLGVIDDFILREGTDYGDYEQPLAHKRAQVKAQLDAGTAEIWFDPDSETVTLRRSDEPPPP